MGAAFQHLRREERPVALAMAGLPHAISDLLLDDKVMSFLRRSARYALGDVGAQDVREAIEFPVVDAGRAIVPEALDLAVRATHGYPFMIQVVGSQMWRRAGGAAVIDIDVARRAVRAAIPQMAQLVHEPLLADLSATDRAFLAAMAVDDGPSRMRDVQERLGVDRNYASQYRLRLIAAEVIEPAGRGLVRFELPYLREYLRSIGAVRSTPEEVAELAQLRDALGPPSGDSALMSDRELAGRLDAAPDRVDDVGVDRRGPGD